MKIVSSSCTAVTQPVSLREQRDDDDKVGRGAGGTQPVLSVHIVIPETENIIAVKRLLSVSPAIQLLAAIIRGIDKQEILLK